MIRRSTPITELNCRINRLEFASAVCVGLNRDCKPSDLSIFMLLFTTFSISGAMLFPRTIIVS